MGDSVSAWQLGAIEDDLLPLSESVVQQQQKQLARNTWQHENCFSRSLVRKPTIQSSSLRHQPLPLHVRRLPPARPVSSVVGRRVGDGIGSPGVGMVNNPGILKEERKTKQNITTFGSYRLGGSHPGSLPHAQTQQQSVPFGTGAWAQSF